MELIKPEKVERIFIVGQSDYEDETKDIASYMLEQSYFASLYLSCRDDPKICDEDDEDDEYKSEVDPHFREVDEIVHMGMLDDIDNATGVYIANFDDENDDLDSAICYAKLTGKSIRFEVDNGPEYVDNIVSEHLELAQVLCQVQLELFKEDKDYFKVDEEKYVWFYHHNYKIFDVWHDEFFNNSFIDESAQIPPKVNPFSYYGTKTAARFIEAVIRHSAPSYAELFKRYCLYKHGKIDKRSLIIQQ